MTDRPRETSTSRAESFIEYCETVRGLVPATLVWYRAKLRYFAGFLEAAGIDPDRSTPAEVTPDRVRSYMAHLVEQRGLRPPSVAAHLAVLRAFYRYLVEEEGFPPDQVPTAQVRSPRRSLSVPATVTGEEVARLLEGASRTPTPQRDVALVQFLWQTACRTGEAADLELARLDLARHTVRLVGWGGRERQVPLAPAAEESVRRYLEGERKALLEQLGVSGSRWLFLGVRGLKMSTVELGARFRLIGQLSGLHRPVTPRMLRDTRVLLLLQAGVNPRAVRAFAGYSDPGSLRRHQRLFSRAGLPAEAAPRAGARPRALQDCHGGRKGKDRPPGYLSAAAGGWAGAPDVIHRGRHASSGGSRRDEPAREI